MTRESFDQGYLPNSESFVDDMMLILYSHQGGGINSEKLRFQILVMNL